MPPDLAMSARLLVGGIFVWSAVGKVRAPAAFARTIAALHVPRPLVDLVAWSIIALEAIAGVMLLGGVGGALGVAIAVMLLLAFTIVMVRNAQSAQPIACHCFGSTDDEARPLHTLARLGLLNSLMLVVLLATPTAIPAPGVGHVLSAIGLGVLGIWILEAPTLVGLHRTPVPKYRLLSRRVSYRGLPLAPVNEARRG